jgi:mannose-6-phosphate isomerase-like protein (cupin superfamily)
VSRIDLQPGATRSVHRHDDVEYHLWIPIEGSLEITMGSEPAFPAKPGQAYFMKRGTSHGFRNAGKTAAAVFEIFIKQTVTASNREEIEELAAQLAFLSRPPEY